MIDSRRRVFLGGAGLALLLIGWEAIGRYQLLGKTFPPISDVLCYVSQGRNMSFLWDATVATARSAGLGLLIGCSAAIVLSLVAVLLPSMGNAIARFGVIVNALPIIAIAPVLVATARSFMPVAAAALSVLFGSLTTTTTGLFSRGQEEHDFFTVLGTSRAHRLRFLQLPGAMPAIGDGLKMAAPAAMLGAMIGEWFGAPRGLGVLLQSAMYNYQILLLWSAALLAAMTSILAYSLATVVERVARTRFPRPAHLADISLATAMGDQRGDRRAWIRSAVGSVASLAAIIGVWQVWLLVAGIDPIVMPSPRLVTEAFVTEAATIAEGTVHTAAVAICGLAIGMLFGFLFAVIGQFSEVLSGLIVPATVLARSIPVVAFIPVIARLLGFNDLTVVGVAVVITFFPFFALASSGFHALPPGAMDVFSLHSASRRMEMLHLRVPASVPHLLTALRIAAPLAVLGALAAEWLIGSSGLGFLFGRSKTHFAVGEAWSAIIVAMVLSVVAYTIAAAVERRGRERWT